MKTYIKLSDQSMQPNQAPVVMAESQLEIEEPSFYHVVLLNDDYTPMDFVIEVLINLFQKSYNDAHDIMMQVHHRQRGIAGTYAREIAQEKMNQVLLSAKANDFPLNCLIERV